MSESISSGPTDPGAEIAQKLGTLRAEFEAKLAEARDDAALQRIKSDFFGPKGELTLMSRSVGQLPSEQRPVMGKAINEVKRALESELDRKIQDHEARKRDEELRRSRLDMTLPGRALHAKGAVHPVARVMYEISDIFARMGFSVATGPEVELDFYNFEALNFPPDHPARDMQDTFFVRPPDGRAIKDLVLRTHTSPVQIRAMERQGAPIRIIAPGRVYRCDQDATHSPMFHQIEVLCVDEGVSFAHLKGTLTSFIQSFFGSRGVRFRPSFFPFVEPGAEVDMQCTMCGGEGCRICKQTGWVEILGAGMVHPVLLESCGIDSERYTGFAAGLGLDRIALLRWGLDELAHLYRSDVRFLSQI
jgi:phenylalanyl-tRNA synthetase alpha chain